jgi:hypothetical protein
MIRIALRFNSFLVSDPSSSVRSGGAISNTGCMVPSHLLLERTSHIQNFEPSPAARGTRSTRPRHFLTTILIFS